MKSVDKILESKRVTIVNRGEDGIYGDFTFILCDDYKFEDVFLSIKQTTGYVRYIKIAEIREVVVKVNPE